MQAIDESTRYAESRNRLVRSESPQSPAHLGDVTLSVKPGQRAALVGRHEWAGDHRQDLGQVVLQDAPILPGQTAETAGAVA